jgi:predicted Zn-dependent protease
MEPSYFATRAELFFMERKRFACSLAAGAGIGALAGLAPAGAAALDEGELGHSVFMQLRDDGELLFDSPYYEHLNEIGSLVSAAAAPRYPYPIQFHIVKGDSPNAFSVPGGHIYVNEPLLRMARNRDELGGVLSHETGHMVLHHVAKRIANAKTANLLGTILGIPATILLGPLGGLGADYALGTMQNAQDANLSRHIEAQADEEGARIAAATGQLNPHGMIWFLRMMTKTYGDKGALWLRSHPFDSARVTDLQTLFARNPSIFGAYDATDRSDETYW